MNAPRHIPSIDLIARRPRVTALIARHGRDRVVDALRRAASALRAGGAASVPADADDAAASIEARAIDDLETRSAASLRPVINATGVLLHTNLGRAPLAQAALDRAAAVARGYSNLEFDLANGRRGKRDVHAERLLCELTSAAAAVVVNNNAAATLVVLAALAAGREVIVSRGELVEIGGGFRVPDVMTQSGAILREVGTTNRTRAADYAAAVNDRTSLILRVHPSNFRIEGFAERPALAELVEVGGRLRVPVFEDLGSGWLAPSGVDVPALAGEPAVAESLRLGADLVSFSGDKLPGGPQSGIVAGRADLVERVRRHPLMRAVRADKLAYAALEGTLDLWLSPARRGELPIVGMLTATVDDLDRRAQRLATRLRGAGDVRVMVVDGASAIGGGSAPGAELATRLVALSSASHSAATLEARLRAGDPPVIARVEADRVLIDLRTVAEEDDETVARATAAALRA